MPRIAILDDYQNVALKSADWSALRERAPVTVFNDHLHDLDAVAERLQLFDIVATMRERTPFPRGLVQRLPNLRLLTTTGMRNAAIDVLAAAEAGVTVCGTSGAASVALAWATPELTWGLILGLARHLPREAAAVRNGGWQTAVGRDLAGLTLGVIGLGRLGSQVARIGTAFGMAVIAWSPNLTADRAAQCGATLATKDALLAASDIVTVHMVLSERTRGLIGADDIARMKPEAFLINTSRGPLIDEAAPIAALTNGESPAPDWTCSMSSPCRRIIPCAASTTPW